MSDPLHVIFLSPFLLGIGAVADVQASEPTTSQPELTALAAPPGDTAAGEGAANKGRGTTADRSVEVDGKTVPLQEQAVDLERTSLKGLYRRGPNHVPK